MSRTASLRSRSTGAFAVAAAAALALTPLAAVATETPEATPEAISAETPEEGADTQPAQAVPPPQTNEFSLGQSLQLRVGPDGEPNSNLANFRWSVNQLTVQGQEEGDQEVPVPDRGDLIRSLLDFSNPPQQDGLATLTADVQNGAGLARTVSLFPQDEEPPVALEAAFTLDGEPIDAWDLVGKSGVLTATYTLTNLSTQTLPVEVENLAGETVTVDVEADVPMVGIGKVLIPQTYSGLALKGGTFGADGRGNNQVQFIALPFRPLSKDGTSTFGWSANVENATIPSMLLQVAPVYIPMDDPETPQDESKGSGGGIAPPPNLDPAVAQIQAGIQQLITGVEQLTADDGGPDPLKVLESNLNEFFSEFGQNIRTVSESIDPANPDSSTALLINAQAAIQRIEEEGLLDKLNEAASLLTPERAQTLADAADPINFVADNADELNAIAAGADDLRLIADNAALIANGVRVGCIDPPGPGEPALPPEVCNNQDAIIAVLESQELQLLADIANSQEFQQLAQLAASAEFQQAADVLAQIGPQLVPLANALQVANTQLPGVITVLSPLLDSLVPALTGLSEQFSIIAGGLEEKNVSLPTVDQVVENITSAILNSPGGQNVTSGLDQIGAGVGDAKSLLGNWLAETIATVKAGAAAAGDAVADVDATVVNLKAEVSGMVMAAHQSPLPYGGDPQNAPEGTVLAGAYEFRVDAADTNQPNTGPRVLVGLVALIGAGALSYFVGRRRGDSHRAAATSPEPELAGAAVGGAAAGAAAGSLEAAAPDEVVPPGDDLSNADAPDADLGEDVDPDGDDKPGASS